MTTDRISKPRNIRSITLACTALLVLASANLVASSAAASLGDDKCRSAIVATNCAHQCYYDQNGKEVCERCTLAAAGICVVDTNPNGGATN